MSDKRVSEMTDDEIRTELLRLRPHSKSGETDVLPRASDLPDGTVVATESAAWIARPFTSLRNRWQNTHGFRNNDSDVDEALAAGARVLRYGYPVGGGDE